MTRQALYLFVLLFFNFAICKSLENRVLQHCYLKELFLNLKFSFVDYFRLIQGWYIFFTYNQLI